MITGVAEDQRRQALGVVCPNTLFPYVREALDNLVVRGGFPPLNLAPINFEAAFSQAMQQAETQASPEVKH